MRVYNAIEKCDISKVLTICTNNHPMVATMKGRVTDDNIDAVVKKFEDAMVGVYNELMMVVGRESNLLLVALNVEDEMNQGKYRVESFVIEEKELMEAKKVEIWGENDSLELYSYQFLSREEVVNMNMLTNMDINEFVANVLIEVTRFGISEDEVRKFNNELSKSLVEYDIKEEVEQMRESCDANEFLDRMVDMLNITDKPRFFSGKVSDSRIIAKRNRELIKAELDKYKKENANEYR